MNKTRERCMVEDGHMNVEFMDHKDFAETRI